MTRSRLFILLSFLAALAPSTLVGCLAQSAVGSADDQIDHICAKAGVQEIIGARPTESAGVTTCSAAVSGTSLWVGAHARYPLSHARIEHDKECEAMAAAAPVRHPELGEEACLITEDARLKVTAIIIRKGSLHIGVRYATTAKDAATTERTALEVARRLAGQPR